MRKRRAYFTRRGPAPRETLMWGFRSTIPPFLWAIFGLLPGITTPRGIHHKPRSLGMGDYLR